MSGLFGALWLALQGAAGIHESILTCANVNAK